MGYFNSIIQPDSYPPITQTSIASHLVVFHDKTGSAWAMLDDLQGLANVLLCMCDAVGLHLQYHAWVLGCTPQYLTAI